MTSLTGLESSVDRRDDDDRDTLGAFQVVELNMTFSLPDRVL
jgi:hypothetical protein